MHWSSEPPRRYRNRVKLSHFDVDVFLRDHWQQRPLLIRNPWTEWRNPLDPDDLAGLACEEDIESRLITRPRGKWTVEHGPLAEARFAALPPKNWTLLVQAVDHLVPGVAALIDAFRFIPDWRIDDVMVSYAVDGGGVGAHFDRYDVFLIQGLGQRRWRVGGPCDDASALLPHADLRLLAEFEAVDEWLLGPGDILYLPPGIAHDGVAVGGDCMTYSIGFRAPSRGELIADWCDHLLETLDDDDRYRDPPIEPQRNPGEILDPAIARMHAMVAETLGDRDAFARWFGQFTTAPKDRDVDRTLAEPIGLEDLRRLLAAARPLRRNPASRFAFIRNGTGVLLFVDGERFDCMNEVATFAESICADRQVAIGPDALHSAPVAALIVQLVNAGAMSFDDDE